MNQALSRPPRRGVLVHAAGDQLGVVGKAIGFGQRQSLSGLPFGILGAAITAGVAVADIGGPARYFAIEFALAAGGLLVSLASFAGMVRDAPADALPG